MKSLSAYKQNHVSMYAGYFVDVAFLQSGGVQNMKIRRDMEQEVNACVPDDCTSSTQWDDGNKSIEFGCFKQD